jgi:hypothetical protein
MEPGVERVEDFKTLAERLGLEPEPELVAELRVGLA